MITRRDFVKSGSRILMGALPLVSACNRLSSRDEAADNDDHGKPHNNSKHTKLLPAVNAYSFSQLFAQKKMDLFQFCDYCAKLGAKAVDLTGYFFPGWPAVPSEPYIKKLKSHVGDLGMAVSGTGVRNDFATSDRNVREQGIALTKQWIEVAAKLGAPVIRVFAGRCARNTSSKEAEKWTADAAGICAETGKKFNVAVGLQNHGNLIKNADTHIRILKRVNHSHCGAIADTGYYLTKDPYQDFARIAPYAVNWQIKQTLTSKANGPRIDLEKFIKIIRQSTYRGYLPIETLRMNRNNYDPHKEVKDLLERLQKAVSAQPQ